MIGASRRAASGKRIFVLNGSVVGLRLETFAPSSRQIVRGMSSGVCGKLFELACAWAPCARAKLLWPFGGPLGAHDGAHALVSIHAHDDMRWLDEEVQGECA